MSKALKAVAKRHRPTVAEKMSPENGYNENKHLFPEDLQKAGIISKDESTDLNGCLDDLVSGGDALAGALKGAKAGKVNKDRLNDDDFINALIASGAGVDDDDTDDDDTDDDGDDLGIDEKVTA
jgi:hypothetical protein